MLSVLAGCVSSRQAEPAIIRVMTWNIHHGEGLDGRVDLERIASLIKSERADIVALQEVDNGVARTSRRDLPKELAALTGMTSVFSNNIAYQGGEYGNAVLSRFPILAATNLHYQMIRPREQRGLLQVTLDVHGHKLRLLNTHLDYRPDDSERLSNANQITTVATSHAGLPVLLCGDFNDTPGSRTYAKLNESFADGWQVAGQGQGFSYPAADAKRRIDYIWTSQNANIKALKIWIPTSTASDHLPVVGEFELR